MNKKEWCATVKEKKVYTAPKYYSIGEFSKKTGVSTHFLKFYEAKGVFDPVVKENGYRYYGFKDGSCVLECRWMKNLGFSVKDIAKNARDNTSEELESMLNAQQDALERQLFLQQMYLQGLQKLREGLRFCREEYWSVRVVPEQWFLPHTMNGEFLEDDRIYKQLPEWLEWMPITVSAQKIGITEVEELNEEWGMGIESLDAEQIGLVLQEPVQVLRFGRVMEWYHSSLNVNDGSEEIRIYKECQRKARSLNLIPKSVIYRKVLCRTEKDGKRWKHCVYQVPVRLPE